MRGVVFALLAVTMACTGPSPESGRTTGSPNRPVDGAVSSDAAGPSNGPSADGAATSVDAAVRAPDSSSPGGAVQDGSPGDAPEPRGDAEPDAPATNRGIPSGAPWVAFYGTTTQMGSLSTAASTFHLINIDADPSGTFTPPQIAELRNGGQNRVISYLDVGSCEQYRSWWNTAPGYVPCAQNTAAQIGPYSGYPSEVWMNVGDADYQSLIVGYVAPRLAAQGVDGFFLDNLEIVEHGTSTTNGPCDAACSQGGLDLVRKLREAFPDKLLVMNNASSAVTRLGTTAGVPFASLLDGVVRESVYVPSYDAAGEAQLLAWQGMNLAPGGRPFWVGTEDFVGDCTATAAALNVYTQSRAKGFSPYATNASAGQTVICYWGF